MAYSDKELETLLQNAAERGADECLQRMGITEENIHEIRSMLDVFRAVRRGVLNGITKLIMLGIVGALLAVAYSFGISK